MGAHCVTRFRWTRLVLAAAVTISTHQAFSASSYTNDLNQAKAGTMPEPEEFMVLNGEFAFRSDGAETWLELPGTPTDTYVLLFGPGCDPQTDAVVSVRAHIHALTRGRRAPAFGIGALGLGGFRLQVTPAKGKLELIQGDNVVSDQAHRWKSGTWTALRLDITRKNDQWEVRGKAWPRDEAEPDSWQLTYQSDVKLYPGQASLWGIPYSSLPIRFDNLALDRPGTSP